VDFGYARQVAYNEKFELMPDIAQAVKVEDERVFTFTLRRGHKWSDGRPFTSADFKFWWDDVANHPDLGAGQLHEALMVGDEKPKVEFPDALTVRFSWSKPNPRFLPALAGPSPLYIYRPRHFLRRFHEKYADKKRLEAWNKDNAKGWVRQFNRRDRLYYANRPELPTLDPWIVKTEPPSLRFEFERNPFYHRVDSQGRQLPYIDRIIMLVADSKIIPAKAGAGESDLQARYLNFEHLTFLKRSAQLQRANFRVDRWQTASGAQLALFPNFLVKDPEWRKLMRDVRFRRALSLAVDRREINEVLFLGLAKVGANTVLPGSPLYRPEYREAWHKLDIAGANKLLDEIGLTRRNREGYRLMANGEPLEIIVEAPSENAEFSDVLALIKDSWRKAGVKLFVKSHRREVMRRRANTGEAHMTLFSGIDFALCRPDTPPTEFAPTREDQLQWMRWGQWVQTGGKQGDKIDDPAAQALVDLHHDWEKAPDTAARSVIWHRILALWSEQVFTIGILGGTPQPVVVNPRLRNVPARALYAWDPGAHFGIYRPDTFWFAEEPKRAEAR
jgi:peptide/nickel transport system substrate-binding protein